MSYIGNQPISAAFLTDTFSGNGSTVAFTMSVAPANTSSVIVAITGVLQDPSTYSVSGTTLTFSAAPPSGTNNISVRYLGIPASGVTTTAYRTVTDSTATAGQTTFTIPSYTVGYVDVYRNGSRLAAADYTATTGTTVVLASAASAGDTITTESFYVSSVLNAIQQYNGLSVNQVLTSPTANTLTSASGSNLQLQTNGGTTALTLDTAGNAGLGVTPSAWSGRTAIQLPDQGYVVTSGSSILLGSNVYFNGASRTYITTAAAADYRQINGEHRWEYAPSGTAGNAITFTQAMTLNASGYLAIGDQTSPTTRVDIRGTSANVASTVQIVGTGVSTLLLGQNADGGVIRGQGGNNSLTFYTGGTGDTAASGSGSARAFLSSGGLFSAGDTPGYLNLGYFRFNYGAAQGTQIFCISAYPTVNEDSANFYSVTGSGASTSATAMRVAKNSGTSRSINAAGTINASGADYAEYMVKAGSFTVAKGDVVGIDAEGKLTNVFADAVSFVVKSTNPSYVGGDVWFNEKQPVDSDMKPITEGPVYDAWVARMEAARATVDRIAFSGQVPVNVTGATAGQYIIPVNDNGGIVGQAVSNPTFEQYQIAVGKVIAIEQDGRARIIVKVA